jgi:hypothetical protein
MAVEENMWNRLLSSPYAHIVSAIVLTAGLVAILLAGNPKPPGTAKFEVSAHGSARTEAPLARSAGAAAHGGLPAGTSADRSFELPERPDPRAAH